MSPDSDTDAGTPVFEEEKAETPLEELMGPDESSDLVDLDEAALNAAEELDELDALDVVPTEVPQPDWADTPLDETEPQENWVDEPLEGQAPTDEQAVLSTSGQPDSARKRKRTDRLLQGLLLLNLVLLGVMLASSDSTETPGPTGPTEVRPDPFLQQPRQLPLPTSELWERSVRAAGRGDYTRAVQLLEHHLRTATGMTDLERQLVYNQLALYLVKDGRLAESQEYSLKFQQLMSRSYLPEDLLQSASRAAEKGMFPEMRMAYARFLLQLKQASPALRKLKAEAYLKLGDSYRLEAERAAEKAEQAEVERALELRGRPPAASRKGKSEKSQQGGFTSSRKETPQANHSSPNKGTPQKGHDE